MTTDRQNRETSKIIELGPPPSLADDARALATGSENPVDALASLFLGVVEELRLQLAVVTSRREALERGSFDPELAKAAATLGKAIQGCLSEVRQRDRQSARERRGLRMDVVMDFLRAQPIEKRLHILREIAGTVDDEQRSVL